MHSVNIEISELLIVRVLFIRMNHACACEETLENLILGRGMLPRSYFFLQPGTYTC